MKTRGSPLGVAMTGSIVLSYIKPTGSPPPFWKTIGSAKELIKAIPLVDVRTEDGSYQTPRSRVYGLG